MINVERNQSIANPGNLVPRSQKKKQIMSKNFRGICTPTQKKGERDIEKINVQSKKNHSDKFEWNLNSHTRKKGGATVMKKI